MNVYLTDNEVTALLSVINEWIEIMGSGDDVDLVNDKLDEGLGRAAYKLSRGRGWERVYADYATKKKK